MKNLRKFLFMLLGFILAVSLFMACEADDDGNDDGDGGSGNKQYTFTLHNRTEGVLTNVTINSQTCSKLYTDESCTKTYSSKPSSITISAESASSNGVQNKTTATYRPGNETSYNYNLLLTSGQYSLWVVNDTISDSLTAIGINPLGSGYEQSWYFSSPIRNDGRKYWMGFFDTSDNDVHIGGKSSGSSTDDLIWKWTNITPGRNSYGSKHFTLIAGE
ncbi:MAG: hypothetical protein GY754_08765 [bacterium]|nr:hypothetical protein [bacterium]